jgi:hypothetical protein
MMASASSRARFTSSFGSVTPLGWCVRAISAGDEVDVFFGPLQTGLVGPARTVDNDPAMLDQLFPAPPLEGVHLPRLKLLDARHGLGRAAASSA